MDVEQKSDKPKYNEGGACSDCSALAVLRHYAVFLYLCVIAFGAHAPWSLHSIA